MKYLSVCSGMEAASVAWHPLGWEPVGFSEIEPFPCAILKHRFPNTPNYGSLTEYQSWPIEPGSVDLLVGGTPCQSFSVAGLRKGMSDPRGNLALTFLGLADRLRPRWIVWENVPGVLSSNGGRDFGAFLGALGQLGFGWAYRVLDAQHFGVPQRRRRVFVVATSTGDGRLAGEVLSLPEGLRGYLEARRKKGQGAPSGPAGGVDADGLQSTVGTLCADTHPGAYSGQDAYTGRLIPQVADTVTAKFSKGAEALQQGAQSGGNCIPVQPPIAMRESGQGFWMQDDKAGPIRAEGENRPSRPSHVIGEPIPYRKAKRAQSDKDDESWVEGDVSNTLNNFDLGDTRTTHAVVEPAPVISPTVTTCKGSRGGCSSEAIDEIEAIHKALQPIPIDLRNATRNPEKHDEQNRQGVGVGDHGDPAHTLTKEFVHGVAQPIEPKIIQASELRLQGKITEQDVCPTLKANTKSGDTEPLALQPVAFQPGNLRRQAGADPSTEVFPTVKCDAGDQAPHVAHSTFTTRTGNERVESEALVAAAFKSGQGAAARSIGWSEQVSPTLPSNAGGNTSPAVIGTMTNMAVRRLTPVECERLQGFPDNWSRIPWKGKAEKDCPDGPRYKACGNSMAVPVMRWIGRQIAEVEARHAKGKTA